MWTLRRAWRTLNDERHSFLRLARQRVPFGDVGVRLAAARKAAGLTQKDVAARLSISQPRVSRIERGYDLHLSTLRSYAEALGLGLRVDVVASGSSRVGEAVRDLFELPADENDQLVLPIFRDERFRTQRDVVLSIKPIYSDAIMAGSKTVELRRRFPVGVPGGTVAFIYSTSPVKALVGTAEIAFVQRGQTSRIWRDHHVRACIDQTSFDRYFDGQDEGFAIHLERPRAFARPVPLAELRENFEFEPPQSFLYARPPLRAALLHERTEVSDRH